MTIDVDYTWTDYDCTYFSCHDSGGGSGKAYCLDHNITTPGAGGTYYDGTPVRNVGWYSEWQCMMLDYIAYHAYGLSPGDAMMHAAWAVWNVVHGEGYRPITSIYESAKAYANRGGGGPERGFAHAYNLGGGSQPILYGARARTGSVRVSKVYEGANNRAFSLHITVRSGGQVALNEDFTLMGGQSRTFDDLPADATYEVSEVSSSHYETTWTNRTGTVGENACAQVTCTNVDHGWLVVEKNLTI